MPVDYKVWDEAYDNSPWATFFASSQWHKVTEGLGRDASFEWKGIVTPLREIKLAKGFLTGYESTIPGVPSGPVALRVPERDMIAEYWEELDERTQGRFLVHLRPDSPFKNTYFRTVVIKSHILKIKDRHKKISENHKRQIQKAQNAGIIVAPARRNEDFKAYLDVYEISLARWTKRPARIYKEDFFRRIREIVLPENMGCFFIAWKDSLPQSCALVFFEKKRAVYWHGASIDDPVAGAGHFLHWKIMEEIETRGMEMYDFGPSSGLEGVERFKEGFGAVSEEHLTVVGPARIFGSYFINSKTR
jgi:hypothetical protein